MGKTDHFVVDLLRKTDDLGSDLFRQAGQGFNHRRTIYWIPRLSSLPGFLPIEDGQPPRTPTLAQMGVVCTLQASSVGEGPEGERRQLGVHRIYHVGVQKASKTSRGTYPP